MNLVLSMQFSMPTYTETVYMQAGVRACIGYKRTWRNRKNGYGHSTISSQPSLCVCDTYGVRGSCNSNNNKVAVMVVVAVGRQKPTKRRD